MNYRKLFSNITYRGLVRAVKTDYHVLEGPSHYVVLSTNYQYRIVDKKAVKFLIKKFGATRSVTAKEVLSECKNSQYFNSRFDALHTLYALVGTQQGKISKIEQKRGTIFFNVWAAA